jgi:DnaJ-class molecular chaperone
MDHYATLGLSKTATTDEIKKAYRKLASLHHPDKGGDKEKFQSIQAAYAVLSDEQKRQEYDNPMPQPQMFSGGFPGGFNFGGPQGHAGMHDFINEMLFRQSRQPQHAMYRTNVFVSLEQVYFGAEQNLTLQTPAGNHNVNITVPKGIHDGAQVRIETVIPNAILMVEFRIHKHLKFDRHGQDLICNHAVSVLDLIIGTSFEFTAINGKTLEVTIPPMTQPNRQMKLSGYGLPIPNSAAHGDQIIVLKPFIPDGIDQTVIDSIRQTKKLVK